MGKPVSSDKEREGNIQPEVLQSDQILTADDLNVLDLNAVMDGCPGFEWMDELRDKANWPPTKPQLTLPA